MNPLILTWVIAFLILGVIAALLGLTGAVGAWTFIFLAASIVGLGAVLAVGNLRARRPKAR